ncbi:hypothetical protein llap_7785 [Limosa lapponica baueri]|uniref:Uncharacterized protein n=1 Tax=Limosa lapponica baueri TaxID=1758121 RepID=A0A2I0U770_LIMLA|nr:hypothetical protein llap_7785 [Limosa lapponica baueri]
MEDERNDASCLKNLLVMNFEPRREEKINIFWDKCNETPVQRPVTAKPIEFTLREELEEAQSVNNGIEQFYKFRSVFTLNSLSYFDYPVAPRSHAYYQAPLCWSDTYKEQKTSNVMRSGIVFCTLVNAKDSKDAGICYSGIDDKTLANQVMITLKHANSTAIDDNLILSPQKRDLIMCVGSNAKPNPKVSSEF